MRMGVRSIAQVVAVLAVVAVGQGRARAATEPEFAIGLGYTHVSLDDTSIGDMAEEGGFRFEPRFTFAPLDDAPQFRLGVGMGFSFFYDETDSSAIFIDDDGDVFIGDADEYENLFLWTPELQASYRHTFDSGLVLEGGVGVGGVFAYYTAGEEFFNTYYDEQLDEGDITWSVRPFARAGYRSDGFTLGLETSYLVGGDLDFTPEIGGNIDEFFVGAFFAWTW